MAEVRSSAAQAPNYIKENAGESAAEGIVAEEVSAGKSSAEEPAEVSAAVTAEAAEGSTGEAETAAEVAVEGSAEPAYAEEPVGTSAGETSSAGIVAEEVSAGKTSAEEPAEGSAEPAYAEEPMGTSAGETSSAGIVAEEVSAGKSSVEEPVGESVPAAPAPAPARRIRVVSIGGGTGQPALIAALRETGLPLQLDAVVAMADDGRSTGILREREGMLPPGDLRKCLVALAADPAGPLARALEHRFPYLDNHTMGNLLLTALVDEGRDLPGALALVGRALGCVGRALPSTLDMVELSGHTAAGEEVRGQAALSYGAGRLASVSLAPATARAYEPAVRAIEEADLIVMGPGSLFTSLMPNLLVPGIAAALRATRAHRLFVCPCADVPGETEGMDAEAYLDALDAAGMLDLVDSALIHVRDERARPHFACRDPRCRHFPPVALAEGAEERLRARGLANIYLRDLASEESCLSYDRELLARALAEVVADVVLR